MTKSMHVFVTLKIRYVFNIPFNARHKNRLNSYNYVQTADLLTLPAALFIGWFRSCDLMKKMTERNLEMTVAGKKFIILQSLKVLMKEHIMKPRMSLF